MGENPLDRIKAIANAFKDFQFEIGADNIKIIHRDFSISIDIKNKKAYYYLAKILISNLNILGEILKEIEKNSRE